MLGHLLLPIVLISIIGGLALEQHVLTAGIAVTTTDDVTGEGFLAYKRAVQKYVHDNPGITGSVPLASLAPADVTGVTSAMHNLVQKTSAGTTIETWWDGTGSARIGALERLSQGDIAIGLSDGNSWISPSGGNMGPLPYAVAAGDVVSVVTFTGIGF